MPLPTFLLLGAPRAGTTSVHRWFGSHPDVCMSRPKETQFFSLHHHRGVDAYRACFAHHAGEPVVGESTPMYLALPHVPARIAALLPDVSLLAILREPVAQAISSWWMLRRMGAERRSFEQAVRQEMTRPPLGADESEAYWRAVLAASERGRPVDDVRYLMIGHYAASLRRYLEHFDRDQLTVLLYDDLREDPAGSLRRIAHAVGVDVDRATAATLPRTNSSTGPVEAWTRRRLSWVPSARVRRAAHRAAAGLDRSGPPSIDPRLREELRDWFADANQGLSGLIDRDVAPWFAPTVRQP